MKSRAAPCLALLLSSCSFVDPQVGPQQACLSGSAASSYAPGYVDSGSALSASDAAGAAGTSPAVYGRVSGNLLIADQYNNRVIEITREGSIVWAFGDGSNVPGPTSVVAPNDVERLPNGRTLIAGTGGPPGADYTCPSGGCPDNRVIIVDDDTGAIQWQYGADQGDAGSGDNQLNVPVAAVLFLYKQGEENILITDQGNNRVIEVSVKNKDKKNGMRVYFPQPGTGEALATPNSAERLENGNTLIADTGHGRVIEVDPTGRNILRTFQGTLGGHPLKSPAFASRLPDGNTLITDSSTNDIIELDTSSPPEVVWSFSTTGRNPCGPPPQPTSAVRLSNKDTLITDQFNDQVLEVDHALPPKLVYTYGKLGIGGSGIGLLNVPYDARVIGDYTGLTAPCTKTSPTCLHL